MRTERRVPLRARAGPAMLALATACNGTTSYLDATGRAGRDEARLGIWLTATSCVVVLLVIAAIVAGIARRRDDDEGTGRRQVRTGLAWIYWGVGATVIVLLVAFGGTMVTLQATARPPSRPVVTLDVTGHQWWWEVRYSDAAGTDLGFVTANEVHLPVGQPVRVRLRSADVIHSFWLPQIAGKTDVIPGQVNEMWLEADRAGTSRGPCGEYCGLQHANMSIAVTAESPAEFRAWEAQRRGESVVPTDDVSRTGRAVFTRSCGACHAVGGTEAQGRVGPDLTHLASRPFIGAGALSNTPANLARWIPNAPAVKEGSRMPAMPLTPAELRDLVAYLGTLR
ncbi:MAG: cytochrome c oxidase subunit II [Gemmatimonadaceae bacterium]